MSPRKALVASDSIIANDPRVLRQIRWLINDGWTVDSLGRGQQPPEVNGIHHEMPTRTFGTRLAANVLLPNRLRYRTLVASTIPRSLRGGSSDPEYELAVLNEIELLPWFVSVRHRLVKASPVGRAHLDLHEYAPSQRSGRVHALLFKRYRGWQTTFVAADAFDSRSVVSPGIARLYSEHFPIPQPGVIRSVPDHVEQLPSPISPQDIKLIHHGNASATRGLELMIDAMPYIDQRFSLHLMLVGSQKVIQDLKRRASSLGDRVRFHPPVDVRNVSVALNRYDLEVIFFPPVTENLRYALPNKLFEAIQGRVGIVVGSSPDMVELVSSHGNGVVVRDWTASSLATTINSLTIADIERVKSASHAAAATLNAEVEMVRFLGIIDGPNRGLRS